MKMYSWHSLKKKKNVIGFLFTIEMRLQAAGRAASQHKLIFGGVAVHWIPGVTTNRISRLFSADPLMISD